MEEQTKMLTPEQLEEELGPSIPEGLNTKDVIDGVILALTPVQERTRAIDKDLFKRGVVYARYESDVPVIKTALEVLAHLGESLLLGPAGIAHMGLAVKELVVFLIELYRHRVRVSDPVEVSVLLLLHQKRSGMTSKEISQRLIEAHGRDVAPSRAEIDAALDRLANAVAASGPKPLVRADGQIWKSLV